MNSLTKFFANSFSKQQKLGKYSFSFVKPPRNTSFKKLQESDINYFRSFLDSHSILTDKESITPFNQDWNKIFHGETQLVLQPKTTEQLAKIMKYCNEQKIAVVPQGGNTGLVGGSVPVHDEIVVSLNKMNKVLSFDQNTQVVTVEAGCILEALNDYLKPFNCEVPVDLAAKGSCQIGGNIATHAGGIRLIKYGPLKAHVLGLEIVTPTGQILDLTNTMRKDNTGFDLKQLFIGSEGTLGIITKANVAAFKQDKLNNLILVQCKDFNQALQVRNEAKSFLGKDISALEYLDGITLDIVLNNSRGKTYNPFTNMQDNDKKAYILIEISCNYNIEEVVERLFNRLEELGIYEDMVSSQSEEQYKMLWHLRDGVAEAVVHIGSNVAYDISCDPKYFGEITNIMRERCKQIAETTSCGHIGDGNLHLMFAAHNEECVKKMEEEHEKFLYDWVKSVGGSISAEHGIGLQKRPYLWEHKNQVALDYMKKLKEVFDPNHILNPYKIV
ncbi:FAD linked oxidase family protein (macronuclear) [Tetrahymena thermophila SB210]|uniref:FAD linked oxidase family protein n=1 Tax=Tetrahymena thermophila (strain SB210) TaxID=312017 RepID=I7MAX7_TETTS|nr:FAD linked oxidase family protein [Tetrahymena thermophila SB210]EAS06342.2 FAD linked oxidase family protein [Tetrahymena thermophila SB210]|eukprot:XP_001026587.2 FAD linked oxidase family protein [Tetrahymena thermophila SB210]